MDWTLNRLSADTFRYWSVITKAVSEIWLARPCNIFFPFHCLSSLSEERQGRSNWLALVRRLLWERNKILIRRLNWEGRIIIYTINFTESHVLSQSSQRALIFANLSAKLHVFYSTVSLHPKHWFKRRWQYLLHVDPACQVWRLFHLTHRFFSFFSSSALDLLASGFNQKTELAHPNYPCIPAGPLRHAPVASPTN